MTNSPRFFNASKPILLSFLLFIVLGAGCTKVKVAMESCAAPSANGTSTQSSKGAGGAEGCLKIKVPCGKICAINGQPNCSIGNSSWTCQTVFEGNSCDCQCKA